MMAYIVDYTGDHAFVDGVADATYVDPDGNTDTGVKVRKGTLGVSDVQGALFAIAPGDVPFAVWTDTLDTATLKVNGQLTVAGTSYTVVGILATIPDGSQTRIMCREER